MVAPRVRAVHCFYIHPQITSSDMPSTPVIAWYRNDLRIADHAPLAAAARAGVPVIAVFVLDENPANPWPAGGASRWWLHHSLRHVAPVAAPALRRDLAAPGLARVRAPREQPGIDATLAPVEVPRRSRLARVRAPPAVSTFPPCPTRRCAPDFARFPWRSDAALLAPGSAAAPAIRSSMPACASCGTRAGCTTACAWSWPPSSSSTCCCPGRTARRWFWDTLVDADLASNTLGWQWVAGCGADAAPYFRIFNPVLQGEKFDPTAPTCAAGCRNTRNKMVTRDG
jgi:hypothetical protein